MQHLAEAHDHGRPAPAIGSGMRGRYLQWVHFAEATAARGPTANVLLAVYRADSADIMICFPLWSVRMLRLLTDAHPRTSVYLDRPLARPGFAKASEESRRFANAGCDRWPEPRTVGRRTGKVGQAGASVSP